MKRASLLAALAAADAALPPPAGQLSLAELEQRWRRRRAQRVLLATAAAAGLSCLWLYSRIPATEQTTAPTLSAAALVALADEWAQLRADVAATLPSPQAATEALRRRARAAATVAACAADLAAFDTTAAARQLERARSLWPAGANWPAGAPTASEPRGTHR